MLTLGLTNNFIFLLLACSFVPLARMDGPFGLDRTKEAVFILLSGLMFIVSPGMPASMNIVALMMGLLTVFILSSIMWTDQPHLFPVEGLRWGALLWLLLSAQRLPADLLLQFIFIPSVVIALYGSTQQLFKQDFVDKRFTKYLYKRTRFLSFFGNSNPSSAYLVPNVFIGLWLIQNVSHWYYIPTAIVMGGVFLSQCRAAWVASACGVMIIIPATIPLFAVAGIFTYLKRFGGLESIFHRTLMIQVAIEMWKSRKWFGWGPRIFRVKHYKALADLNIKDPTILGDKDTPGRYQFTQGRRAHNDYIEFLAEYGIVGIILILAFFAMSIFSVSHDRILLAGIVAMLVNASMFYVFHDTVLTIPFIIIMAAGSHNMVSFDFYPAELILKIVVLISMLIPLRRLMGNYYVNKGEYFKAVECEPFNNLYLTRFAAILGSNEVKNYPAALAVVLQALSHPDGEERDYSMLNAIGKIAFNNGALDYAYQSFLHAYTHNPSYKDTIKSLTEMEKLDAEQYPAPFFTKCNTQTKAA